MTQEEEKQVSVGCYRIGSKEIAPWLRRIIELENRVAGLERLYGEKLVAQPREPVNV